MMRVYYVYVCLFWESQTVLHLGYRGSANSEAEHVYTHAQILTHTGAQGDDSCLSSSQRPVLGDR